MKKILILITIPILFVFLHTSLYAQFGTAMPFLQSPPSPTDWGMAFSNVANSNDSPLGHFSNPAHIGSLSYNQNLSFGILTNTDSYFGMGNIEVSSFGLTAGTPIGKMGDVQLSSGIGFIQYYVDLGEYVRTWEDGQVMGKYDSYESSDQISFSLSGEYYVKLSLGFGIKFLKSSMTALDEENKTSIVNSTALDIGLLVDVPVFKNLKINDDFSTDFTVSLGYTLQNLGDELDYELVTDPLPRYAAFGYALKGDLKYDLNDDIIKLISIDFAASASDILVNRDSQGYDYKGITGDINILSNLLALEPSDNVSSSFGLNIGLFDLFHYLYGRNYNEYGYDGLLFKSEGIMIESKGVFKMLNHFIDNKTLDYIAHHLNIVYVDVTRQNNNNLYSENGNSLLYLTFGGFSILDILLDLQLECHMID
jgi:hypothetical protein